MTASGAAAPGKTGKYDKFKVKVLLLKFKIKRKQVCLLVLFNDCIQALAIIP